MARGGRVRSTTPAEDRYIVLSAKRYRRTTAQQVANQFLLPQESGSPEKLLPDTPTDLAREWYCLSSRKYPGKGPISDMQYHGVGRHHDQWPHAPTCGCEWDYDGPTIH
ncbi:hypothetical protein TNCV_2407481 [Trichonephila clavipes]|nr:hypothetical protein TNCV_2407481 [Trichonephila clavipes]